MRSSLRWKFVVTLILAILIPMALTTLVSLRVTSSHLEDQLEEESKRALKDIQNELSQQISSANALVAFIAEAVGTKQINIKTDEIHQYIDYLQVFSKFSIIDIYDNNKELVARSTAHSHREIPSLTTLEDPLLSKALLLDSISDYQQFEGGIAIKVISPLLIMETLEVVGIVVVTIPLDFRLMQHIKSLSKAEITVHWNNKGDIATSFQLENGEVKKRIWDGGVDAIESFSDGKVVQQNAKVDHQIYQVSSTGLTNENGKTIGIISAAVTSEEFLQSKKNLQHIIFISAAVFLFIAVITGILISRSFTKPITTLAKTMYLVANGDLEKTVHISRNDEVGELATAFNDMTKNLQQSFKRNEEQKYEILSLQNYLSNIINSMPSILIGVDRDGKITQWNMKAEERTGISVDDALLQPITDVFPQMSNRLSSISESISSKIPMYFTNEKHDSPDGDQYQNVTIYPLVTSGIDGAVIRVDDVTRQYNMERQLNQSRKMDAIGELAGGVAHDFNNMLAGISGAADLLGFSVKEEGKKHLDLIKSATQRAAGLTSKLLTFSRKSELEMETINLQMLIEESIELLKRTIDKKIKITYSSNANNTIVIGNFSELENSIINIGINAAHAMTNGGELSFSLGNIILEDEYCRASEFSLVPGSFVVISIMDTGCGIAPEKMRKIFEPFFTTKEPGKGTGLGLSAVYGVVREHNGAIDVYSEIGIGTVFKMMLPVSDEIYKPTVEDEQIIKGSGTILLVDDEAVIRITAKEILENLNYDVILAENGREAVDIFFKKHDSIDLILLDMIMPEMGGPEAFFKMKEIEPNINIIISSGFSSSGELEKLRENGLFGFINKPFRRAELSQMVSKAILDKTKA